MNSKNNSRPLRNWEICWNCRQPATTEKGGIPFCKNCASYYEPVDANDDDKLYFESVFKPKKYEDFF